MQVLVVLHCGQRDLRCSLHWPDPVQRSRIAEIGVNERRHRGFFPMLSMIGHPSGGEPLMVDVRQSGSGSAGHNPAIRSGDSQQNTCALLPTRRYRLTAPSKESISAPCELTPAGTHPKSPLN